MINKPDNHDDVEQISHYAIFSHNFQLYKLDQLLSVL